MLLNETFDKIAQERETSIRIWSYKTENSNIIFEIFGTRTPFEFELIIKHPDLERTLGGRRLPLNGRDNIVPSQFKLPQNVLDGLCKTLRKYTQKLIHSNSNEYKDFTKDEITLSVEEITKKVFGV